MLANFKILDVNISDTNIEQVCAQIDANIRQRQRGYVCVAPVSTVVSCQEDAAYKQVVNHAQIVTPDGMPIVWLGRMRGRKHIKRTYGPDLMLAVCDKGQARGYRHYLLGATRQTCSRLVSKLKERFPAIQIVGVDCPPFRDLTPEEDLRQIETINAAQPDIVWVGLGSPKQDFWMYRNQQRIHAPVMLGVGAAFDFLSGVKRQAPRWMQCCGLEWFFRLCSEPRRLWRRYLIGNTKFIFFLLREVIQKIGKPA
jgi:N-acetylglucosaminyldiphosphoundecaprenol N-acetyl-beta-D-mannosaminyltransferase